LLAKPTFPSLTRGKEYNYLVKKPIEIKAFNSKRNCLGYRSSLTFMSQRNRNKMTEAEKVMWNQILSRDKTGYRFLRQKPIDRFIVDFLLFKIIIGN
jgi:hypothetical protein